MSFFARTAGRGTRLRKSLNHKSIIHGIGVKGVSGVRLAGTRPPPLG